MAIVVWRGGAEAVAQITTAQITTYDAGTTYGADIDGVSFTTLADTDAATTIDNLFALLNASVHPFYAAVTWARSGTDKLQGTGDTAGVPFTFTVTATGATGVFAAPSDSTACTGPHHFDEGDNFEGGAVPVANDKLVIPAGATHILYGLDFSGTQLDDYLQSDKYTGLIGLNADKFATSLDGKTFSSVDVREYRRDYLKLDVSGGNSEAHIGIQDGPSKGAGSKRVKIDFHNTILDVYVHLTATGSEDINKPACRLLLNEPSAALYIEDAPGGVGVAVEEPGETATVGTITVGNFASSKCLVGEGTTLITFRCGAGTHRVSSAGNFSIQCFGGTLTVFGTDYLVTTMDAYGGTIKDIHDNTGGVEITTLNMFGGKVDLLGSRKPRTITTLSWADGGELDYDTTYCTFTNIAYGTIGDGGKSRMKLSKV